ncbi:AbrB family transcriptional regulator [Niallia nealsonii]|uniref:AbrB family transcriptional regulator n=1 Tax=Niallia nealsonii TaxID=115979 RepID=A0A2N0Z0C4_9BACI|nr:AbrB family transcriptional regulator [Niallia nealsonii]PKG22960.1 AbrB family transcriptional regulator [Niallia nealsonii]
MSYLKLLVSACIGGLLFYFFHLPLAWILGPMIGTIFYTKLTKQLIKMPVLFRDLGFISIGYTIGLTFSKEALVEMFTHLPSMLAMTLSMIAFSLILAFFTTKITHTNYKSTIAGSIPGGLTQMVALCGEMKGIDLAAVTIIQVTRIVSVVMLVPFLVYSPLLHGNEQAGEVMTHMSTSYQWSILPFILLAASAAFLSKKGKFPTPFLIGPIIIIAILVIAGIHAPALPVSLISISQLFIGIDLGLRVKLGEIEKKAMFSTVAIISSFLLVVFSFVLSSILLHLENGITLMTAFIALAPGGMAEMAILGQSVGGDLTVITTYQLFRLLFILFCVPSILKWIFLLLDWNEKRKLVVKSEGK